MTTVVICGDTPLPEELRVLIERGSTAVVIRGAAELADAPVVEGDRVVFWSGGDEPALSRLAGRYAQRERTDRRERLLFVSAEGAPAPADVRPDEVFVWPRDDDRLKMAFLTSA